MTEGTLDITRCESEISFWEVVGEGMVYSRRQQEGDNRNRRWKYQNKCSVQGIEIVQADR